MHEVMLLSAVFGAVVIGLVQLQLPVVVTPQVWVPRAFSSWKLRPPTTGTGVSLSVLVPSPIWKTVLPPQQYAAPLEVSPQV